MASVRGAGRHPPPTGRAELGFSRAPDTPAFVRPLLREKIRILFYNIIGTKMDVAQDVTVTSYFYSFFSLLSLKIFKI